MAMNATDLLGEEIEHVVANDLAIAPFDLFAAQFN
jgi:hypothetical protein